MRRKVFHLALALILLGCLICPYVELAIGWDETIFTTGYDTESTLAVVALLFELVLAIASTIALLFPEVRLVEPLVVKDRVLGFDSGFGILLPDFSPPPPLRI